MIQISNSDRDLMVRYIEQMNAKKQAQGLREFNLQRMANLLARKLKNKKSMPRK